MDEVTASMDDTGTRYIHLAELLEMWETGIEITAERIRQMTVTSGSNLPDKLKKMQAAAEILRGTIDGLSHRMDFQMKVAAQVDAVSEHSCLVEGGREAPLKARKFFNRS